MMHFRVIAGAVCAGILCGGLMAAGFHARSVLAQAATDVSSRQAALQAQLKQLDAEIANLQGNLKTAQNQKQSLERDLNILDAQIQASKLAIKRRNLSIQQLSEGIAQKETTITGLSSKLQDEYDSLAAIMRETDQLDTTSLIVAALTSGSLSDFFADTSQFDAISEKMQASFTVIQTDRKVTETQKNDLQAKLDEETQLRQVQKLQEQVLQQQEAQKNQILSATKGQERAYQDLISSKQQSAAQIRAALFDLSGTKAISFGTALQYAILAQQKTGIRPAFLLGIITEESNLGENVGTGNWQVDMHPTRDRPVFQAVTQSLGLDPNSMPVSKKAWYGWGGAMGPAQFIPSTWVCYAGYVNSVSGKCTGSSGTWTYDPNKDRVGALTGNKPPNPWNPQDAFMAAALYLTDSGAGKQSGEFKAAMCYLAGCGNTSNKDLQFYGNDVLSLAAKYQQQIDIINGGS